MISHSFSLTEYTETLESNIKQFKKSFPQSFLAAETVNNLFWQLYNEEIIPKPEITWQIVAHAMLFGSLTSWSHGFLMTAAGVDEHGWTSIRRSIEFACYIAKIRESDQRAELWINRRNSEEFAKKFTREFSIPKSFFSDKYAHLKDLLVLHDHASDFGVHGNSSMLAQKMDENDPSIRLTVFNNSKDIPLSSTVMIVIGSFILEAIKSELKVLISNHSRIEEKFRILKNLVLSAKDETYKYEFEVRGEREVLETIRASSSLINKKFEQLKRTKSS